MYARNFGRKTAKNTLFDKIRQFVDKKRQNVDYVFLFLIFAVPLQRES